MENDAKFNINEAVRVKLTDLGKQVWMDYHNIPEMVSLKYDLTIEKIDQRADAEGYHAFPLWKLMEIFGPHMSIGAPNCFETTIFIPMDKLTIQQTVAK